MNTSDIPDPVFRDAVAAIDSGDVPALELMLAEHPRLLGERLRAGEGYFRDPYLLWFVAGNPVRSGSLPANVADVTRTIIDYETLPLPFEEEAAAASLRHAS
jgi:peptide-methionine (S)-S-oxide reductase